MRAGPECRGGLLLFWAREDFAAADDDWFILEGVFEAAQERGIFGSGGGGGGTGGGEGRLGTGEGGLEFFRFRFEVGGALAEPGIFRFEGEEAVVGLFEGRFVRGEGVAVGGELSEASLGFLEFAEDGVEAGVGVVHAFLHEGGFGLEAADFEFGGFEGLAVVRGELDALLEGVAFCGERAEGVVRAFPAGFCFCEFCCEAGDAAFDAFAACGFRGEFA